MQIAPNGNIELTPKEAQSISDFIRNALHREWDSYTDHVIVENTSWEDGMRRMDPKMYDMSNTLEQLFFQTL